MRLAALDYGTVTSRLLVADVTDGRLTQLLKQTAITHLGEGLAASGRISAAALERVVQASQGFLQAIAGLSARCQPGDAAQPPMLRAVATSAVRDAANSEELLTRLAGLGIDVEVIAGRREAHLSFTGTLTGFDQDGLDGQTVLVADIGGGSTELIAGRAAPAGQLPEVLQAESIDVGARRVTDLWLADDPPTPSQLAAARVWLRQRLEPWFDQARAAGIQPRKVIAVAGTATSLVAVSKRLEPYDPSQVHGRSLTLAEVGELLKKLAAMDSQARRQVPGLEPGRASVLPGGILVLEEVLRLAGQDSYTASETDILQGIILDAWRQAGEA